MKRRAVSFLRMAMTIALAVGIVLSFEAQSKTHDFTKISEIIAGHQAEIADHGRSHDDIVDLLHVFQGHAQEMADHDHNIAFLPPKRSAAFIALASAHWSLTGVTMSDRRAFDLDRPPRT